MRHESAPSGTGVSARNLLRLAFWLIVTVLLLGGGTAWWRLTVQDRDMREDLLGQARRYAAAINVDRIAALTGTEADLSHPAYQRLKRQLMLLRKADPSARFLYLMGRRDDGTIFFLIDSEPDQSEDYSPPGQVYHEATEVEASVFDSAAERVAGPTEDRWGTWVSASVPVIDTLTGEVVALFGMDVDAADWRAERRAGARLPVAATLILLILCGAGIGLLHMRKKMVTPPHPLWQHVEVVLVVSVGLTVAFFTAWIAQERETRTLAQSFAQLADSELDQVALHLRYIRDFHLKGLARFVEASEDVTREEFRHYVEPLAQDPVVHAWVWAPAVPHARRTEWEHRMRARGVEQFEIWERDETGRRVPARERPVYYPLAYIEPFERNKDALGYDQGYAGDRQRALMAALDSGLPTITAPLALVHLQTERPYLICYQPVSKMQSGGLLQGAIVLGLNATNILVRLQGRGHVHADLWFWREEGPTLLHTCCDPFESRPDLAIRRPILVFGEVFVAEAHPSRDSLALHPHRSGRRVFLTGSLLTAALAFLVGIPLRRREVMEALIVERTRELRESESKYRMLIENQHDYVVKTDPEGRLLFVSPSLCRALGRIEQDTLGELLFPFVHPDDVEMVHRQFDALSHPPHSSYCEHRVQTKDGWRWMAWQGTAVLDEAGGVVFGIGVGRDITARKQAQEALARRLEREQLLVRISALAIASDQVDTFLQESIRILGEGLGVSRAYVFEDHGLTIDNTVEWCAPDIPSAREGLQRLPVTPMEPWISQLREGREVLLANVKDLPDGALKDLLQSQGILSIETVPVFVNGVYYGFIGFDECTGDRSWPDDDVGLLKAIAHIIGGVIERQRAADALQASEDQYRRLTESMRDVVWTADAETFRYTYVSPSVLSLSGWSAEEVVSKPVGEALSSEQRQWLYESIKERTERMRAGLLSSDHFFVNEWEQPCKDGTKVWTEVLTHYQVNPRTGRIEVHGVTRDLTERRRTEARLREHMEELQRWHDVTLDRERRILELKQEINELLHRMGEPPRYEHT